MPHAYLVNSLQASYPHLLHPRHRPPPRGPDGTEAGLATPDAGPEDSPEAGLDHSEAGRDRGGEDAWELHGLQGLELLKAQAAQVL